MLDPELIIVKAGRVTHYIQLVQQKMGSSLAEFLSSHDRQQLVAFNIQLAIQNCIDIAADIVSQRGYGVPGSVNELFYTLEEKGLISPEVTEKMVAAVGFRNLVVHEYGKIDLERMYAITSCDIEDLKEYLEVIFESPEIYDPTSP